MMNTMVVGRDERPFQETDVYPDVRVDPDIYHHPDREGHVSFPWREVRKEECDEYVVKGEEEKVRDSCS